MKFIRITLTGIPLLTKTLNNSWPSLLTSVLKWSLWLRVEILARLWRQWREGWSVQRGDVIIHPKQRPYIRYNQGRCQKDHDDHEKDGKKMSHIGIASFGIAALG